MREFLLQHEQEVVTMLSSLFDEQAQRKQYDAALRAEERSEGRLEGRAEGMLKMLISLVKDGDLPIEKAAMKAKMSMEEFVKLGGFSPAK